MKRPLSSAQAVACETAKHPRCRCRCGGTFHGAGHESLLADESRVGDQGPTPRRQLWLSEELMPNLELYLICGHYANYMCEGCGKCSRCCACATPVPPLKSTISLESQERLRELRRVQQEEYGRQVKPS